MTTAETAHKQPRTTGPGRWLPVALAACAAIVVGALVSSLGAKADPVTPQPTPGRASTTTAPDAGSSKLLPASWQRPQRGWLYVLDVNRLRPEGQILLVDVTGGTVKGVLRTGGSPAFALSPDGSRLFVAAAQNGQDSIHVIDTVTGAPVAQHSLANRRADTVPPVIATLAVSADGDWLYAVTNEILAPGVDQAGITALELRTGRTLRAPLSIGTHCGTTMLAISVRAAVVCSDGIRTWSGPQSLESGALTRIALPTNVTLRNDANGNRFDIGGLSGGVWAAGGEHLITVAGNGTITRVSIGDQRVAGSADLSLSGDRWVPPGRVAGSPDGTRVFVASGRFLDRSDGGADRIHVLDAQNLTVVATMEVSERFTTLSVSTDGRQLYAINSATQTAVAFDTASGAKLGVARQLGETPTLMVTVP